MFEYTSHASGISGDFHGLGFRYGKIEGYLTVMPTFDVNVNVDNDVDLPKDICLKFAPLAKELTSFCGRDFSSNELVSDVVRRLDGDYSVTSAVNAICQSLPQESGIPKPAKLVEIFVKNFAPILPELAEQVKEYEQFLDYLENSLIIGGPDAQPFIDTETQKFFGKSFNSRLHKGVKSKDAKLFYPRAVAGWEGVLLKRGYIGETVQDPLLGEVPIFYKK